MNKLLMFWRGNMKIVILLCVVTISGCGFNFEKMGASLFMNKCNFSIEVQHNDGTGRVFLLASGDSAGFTNGGGDRPIPTYTIGGNTSKFYIESIGNGGYWYTACHNEKNVK